LGAFGVLETARAIVSGQAFAARALHVVLATGDAARPGSAVLAGGAHVVRARHACDASVIRRANTGRAFAVRLAPRLAHAERDVAILAARAFVGGAAEAR